VWLAASRTTVPPLLLRSARHAANPVRMACSQSAAVRTPTSAAIVRQQLTLRPDEALGRCLLNTGWRALDAGLPEPALDLAVAAVAMARLGSRLAQTLVETGKRRIPRRRVTAWQFYRDAITLQVAAIARRTGPRGRWRSSGDLLVTGVGAGSRWVGGRVAAQRGRAGAAGLIRRRRACDPFRPVPAHPVDRSEGKQPP
jgi:hypothetical protein